MSNQKLDGLAKLVFEMGRDVEFLLDRHPESGPGQMGGEIYHPTAPKRANELRTTLSEIQKLFGEILPTQEQP